MKAVVLCAVFAVLMAAPAVAQDNLRTKAHARKPAKPAAAAVQPVDNNEASWRLFRDASWLALPSWSVPIYMKIKQDQDEKDVAVPKPGKRSKRTAQ